MTRDLLTALGAGTGKKPPLKGEVAERSEDGGEASPERGGIAGGDGGVSFVQQSSPCVLYRPTTPQSASRTAPLTGEPIRKSSDDPSVRFADSSPCRGAFEETDCHASAAALARNDKDGEPAAQPAAPTAPAAPTPPAPSAPSAQPIPDLREHFGRLLAQTEALGREFPGFDAVEALRDPDFLRLTAPGVGVDARRAWLALHPELLERRAARAADAALARSLASGAARPREGGGSSGAALSADYRSLPRAEQQRLKERILLAASRGEKIYP